MQKVALYRKYRPENFDQTIGQEHILTILKNAILESKTSHAYLFSGPRGTGKTSVARIFAKAINCNERKDHNPCGKCAFCVAVAESRVLDLVEIDAASNRGIDEIRDLREKVRFAPTDGTYKVFIIDEVHMLTKEAFNALLKTLEEPPAHALFILATTEINKVPTTIISRCQRHDFRRIKLNDIVARLSEIVKKEKLTVTDQALETVAEMAEGGLRDAISLLDQLSSLGITKIDVADVETALGLAPHKTVAEFVAALLADEKSKALKGLEQAARDGVDLVNLTRTSLEYLRKLISTKLGNAEELEGTKELIEELKLTAEKTEIADMVALSEDLLWAQTAFKTNIDPKSILTVLCARVGQKPIAVAAEQAAPSPVSAPKTATKAAVAPVTSSRPNGKWQHFLLEVKARNNTIHAFLRVANPVLAEDTITLIFPYKFHKEQIEESKNRRFVEELLRKIYGNNIILKCDMDGHGGKHHVVETVDNAASILGGHVVD